MSDMLAKKKLNLEALLNDMENLRDALQEGSIEGLDEITAHQKTIILEIESLDREYDSDEGGPGYSRERVEELKALVADIAKIKEALIMIATGRAKDVQQELGALRRSKEAVAGYRKQANVKI